MEPVSPNLERFQINMTERIEASIFDCMDELISNVERCVSAVAVSVRRLETSFNTKFTSLHAALQNYSETNRNNGSSLAGTTPMEKDDYGRACEDILKDLLTHLSTKLSNVPISPLVQSCVKCINDFFVTPDIRRISKDGRKTGGMLHSYKDIFYTDGKPNRRVFLQGDPGMGKSTFTAKLILDWCRIKLSTLESGNPSKDFDDVDTLQGFKYVFHIALRDCVELRSVVDMIKAQIIDEMYPDGERPYTLLNRIMKTEICLVVIDALDDWADPKKKLAVPYIESTLTKCVALFTTRPYKLVDERIKDSDIDSLLELNGIADPDKLVELLLISKQHNEPAHASKQFMEYVRECKLSKCLKSPMTLTLFVCLWKENRVLNGSFCEINCTLLDCLFKKANDNEEYFRTPPFRCFDETRYLCEKIGIVDALAEAAFRFLFPHQIKLVFSKRELRKYLTEDNIQFSLRSGVLSERKCSSDAVRGSSISFLYKTVQEFLSAYHIAKNPDQSIRYLSEYIRNNCLGVYNVAQVFVYLCGLDIQSAYTLSCKLNSNKVEIFRSAIFNKYQTLVISGYNEAKVNQHNPIRLKLMDFNFDDYLSAEETESLKSILATNKSNVRSLVLERYVYSANDVLNILDLSKLCIVRLQIKCCGLCFKDANNSSRLLSILPTLEKMSDFEIKDWDIKAHQVSIPDSIRSLLFVSCHCGSGWLLSLMIKLSEIGHPVQCTLQDCVVNVCEKSQQIYSRTSCEMTNVSLKICKDSPGLYELLRDLRIQCLELESVGNAEMFLQTFPSLTQLKTFALIRAQIDLVEIQLPPSIQSISLRWISCSSIWLYRLLIGLSKLDHNVKCTLDRCDVQSCNSSTLNNLQMIYSDSEPTCDLSNVALRVVNDSPGLYEALRHTSMRMLEFTSKNMALLSQSLPDFTTLRELHLHETDFDSFDLKFPSALAIISLHHCPSSLACLNSLLDKLSALEHPVKCELDRIYCDLTSPDAVEQMVSDVSTSQSDVVSFDRSNVELVVKQSSPGLYNALCGMSRKQTDTRLDLLRNREDVNARALHQADLFRKLGITVQLECGVDRFPAFSHSCAEIKEIVKRAKGVLDNVVFDNIGYTLINSTSIHIYATECSLLEEITEADTDLVTVTDCCVNKQCVGKPLLVIVNKEMESIVEEWIGTFHENIVGMCVLLVDTVKVKDKYIPPRRNIFIKYATVSNILDSADDLLERTVFLMLRELVERCTSMYDILDDRSEIQTEKLIELYTFALHAYGRSKVPDQEKPRIPETIYPDNIDSVIVEVLQIKGVIGCSKTGGKLEVSIDVNDYQIVQDKVQQITLERNIKTKFVSGKFTLFVSSGDPTFGGMGTLGGFAERHPFPCQNLMTEKSEHENLQKLPMKLVALISRHTADAVSSHGSVDLRVGDTIIGHMPNIHAEHLGEILPVDVYEEYQKHCDTRFRTESGELMHGTLIEEETRNHLIATPVHLWGAATSPGLGIIENFIDIGTGADVWITIRDREMGCPFAKRGDSGAMICAQDRRERSLYAIAMLLGRLECNNSDSSSHTCYVAVLLKESFQHLGQLYSSEFKLCKD